GPPGELEEVERPLLLGEPPDQGEARSVFRQPMRPGRLARAAVDGRPLEAPGVDAGVDEVDALGIHREALPEHALDLPIGGDEAVERLDPGVAVVFDPADP